MCQHTTFCLLRAICLTNCVICSSLSVEEKVAFLEIPCLRLNCFQIQLSGTFPSSKAATSTSIEGCFCQLIWHHWDACWCGPVHISLRLGLGLEVVDDLDIIVPATGRANWRHRLRHASGERVLDVFHSRRQWGCPTIPWTSEIILWQGQLVLEFE